MSRPHVSPQIVLFTAGMMVEEIVAGVLFNSMVLLTDGFHLARRPTGLV
jgi:Co/Zn/Cd efflux system component